jgi:hypothetical protein
VAQALQEKDCYVSALFAMWFAHHRGACVRAMFVAAHQIQGVVAEMSSETLTVFAERLIGLTEQLFGSHLSACLHLARAKEGAAHLPRRAPAAHFAFDNRAAALSSLAVSLWAQGLPDQAVATAESSLDEARAGGNAIVVCHSLLHCIYLSFKVEDLDAAGRYSAELTARADELSSDVYRSHALATQGVLMAKCGESDSALVLLRAAVNEFRRLEHVFFRIIFGGEVAEVLGKLGRIQESHAILDETLADAQRGGVYFLLPELLRVKGELYAVQSGICAAIRLSARAGHGPTFGAGCKAR